MESRAESECRSTRARHRRARRRRRRACATLPRIGGRSRPAAAASASWWDTWPENIVRRAHEIAQRAPPR